MPEPDAADVAAVLPTPPIEATSSRASFASCPPEEERERATRTRRVSRSAADEDALEEEENGSAGIRDVRQEPTPEPDVDARKEKGELAEDAERSGVVSPEGDAQIAQAQAQTTGGTDAVVEVDEDGEAAPLYLSYPPLGQREKPHPQAWSSYLHPGSKFRGTQQSDRQEYDVQVEIKDVDLTESRLCGYLRIQGLTDDHPTLTTFFSGEIIGPRHLFRTTHASWNSSEKIDLQHWARFPAFRPLAKAARASPSTFTLKNYLDREHLFMRWKEYFLVPDHRVKSISGASFEGFYYICFDQVGGGVSGIYFHAKSEKYQQLELRHVGDGGCVGAVEMR